MTSDGLRSEYHREDFGPMERGKYAARLKDPANNAVLVPEMAEDIRAYDEAKRGLVGGGEDMNTAVMTTNDVLARLKMFKESRQAEYSLRSLGIFGSFARGQAQEDSDVDVVFETSEPNLFRTSRMKQELEELLARRVDVVRLRERMNPRLKQRILREARYV
jgi:predicted nucleotidyltransferase